MKKGLFACEALARDGKINGNEKYNHWNYFPCLNQFRYATEEREWIYDIKDNTLTFITEEGGYKSYVKKGSFDSAKEKVKSYYNKTEYKLK